MQIHILFCINLRTSKRAETAGLCHGPGSVTGFTPQRTWFKAMTVYLGYVTRKMVLRQNF